MKAEGFTLKKNFIYRYIKKICFLSAAISLTAIIIIIVIAVNIPFSDIFYPTYISYATSASTVYDSDVEYIEVTLNNAKYTGYDCIKRGKVYGSYYYCLVNNSCTFILVKNSSKNPLPEVLDDYSINARIIPSDSLSKKMIRELADDLGWTEEGLNKVASNVIIDETSYHMDIFFYLAICLGTMALILISFIITNIIYIIVPSLYPSCLYFNRLSHGQHSIAHVDYELTSRVILKSGNITLTENHIVATSLFNIEIVPISKIVWAYEHSTWHHFLWFKIKLTYTLHLLCRHHIYIYSSRNTKEDIDTVIQYLKDNYPNIILGYSKDNRKLALKKIKKV